ncbi:MAG: hypothetical protein ACLR8P_16665 [Clostridium fessum]
MQEASVCRTVYLIELVIYRVEMLRNCGLELPKHTFYVDNIFVYQPLPHVKSMYYLDVNFYRYFIGRDDQSVNEKVMISRIDQQILVTKLMLGYYDVTKIKNPKLRHYMVHYLEIMIRRYFNSGDSLGDRGESEEEKRTVAVSETAEFHAVYAPALGLPRTGRKPAGKRRTEGVDRLL